MSKKDETLVVGAETGTAFTYKKFDPTKDERRYCTCGCGLQVVGRAIYRPGHDARHVSEIALFIVDAVENGRQAQQLGKLLRDGLGQLTRPKLVIKAADRLTKNLGEKYTSTVLKAAQVRLEALAEDEGEGDED